MSDRRLCRRKELLDYIVEINKREKRFPSHAEIAARMGWQQEQSVKQALLQLTRDGHLTRTREGRYVAFRLRRKDEDRMGRSIHDPIVVTRILAERALGKSYADIASFIGLNREQVRGIIRRHEQSSQTQTKKPRRAEA